jgi:hypothetical protein
LIRFPQNQIDSAAKFATFTVYCFVWAYHQQAVAMIFEKQERCINAANPHYQIVILGVG